MSGLALDDSAREAPHHEDCDGDVHHAEDCHQRDGCACDTPCDCLEDDGAEDDRGDYDDGLAGW